VSNYTQFEKELLVAAYMFGEERGEDYIAIRDLLERFQLEPRPNWIQRALQSYVDYGYSMDVRHIGQEIDQSISLTGGGLREAEKLIDEGIVPQRRATESVADEPPPSVADSVSATTADEVSLTYHPPIGIDSSRWTGRTLSTTERVELTENIDDALRRIDGLQLTQEKKAQVRSLLLAARTLSEAPEPPLDILHLLFGNVDRLIGIAGFLVGVAGFLSAVV
jgi:hypothetical protein